MRRPVLLSILLACALALVLYGKHRLDQVVAENKNAGDQGFKQKTIDIGIQQPANTNESAPHAASPDSHQDVMATLVEARQALRAKAQTSAEVASDPHTTPNAMIKAAERLGEIVTLEKQHPEFKPEFQSFYLDCAQDAQVITVSRVQCLEKYVMSKGLTGEEERKVVSSTDPAVQKLYHELHP